MVCQKKSFAEFPKPTMDNNNLPRRQIFQEIYIYIIYIYIILLSLPDEIGEHESVWVRQMVQQFEGCCSVLMGVYGSVVQLVGDEGLVQLPVPQFEHRRRHVRVTALPHLPLLHLLLHLLHLTHQSKIFLQIIKFINYY